MFLKNDQIEIPDMFLCPILRELMHDPVIAEDGHTYERRAIERWFAGHNSSPKTNASMTSKKLTDNVNLKQAIEYFVQTENEKYDRELSMLREKAEKFEALESKAAEKSKQVQRQRGDSDDVVTVGQLKELISSLQFVSSGPLVMSAGASLKTLEREADKLYGQKRYADSIELFQQLAEASKPSIKLLNHYADALNKTKHSDKALDIFNHVLSIHPHDHFALIGKASCCENLHRYEEALDSYVKVLSHDPDNAFAEKGVDRVRSKVRSHQRGIAYHPAGQAQAAEHDAGNAHARGSGAFFSHASRAKQREYKPDQARSDHMKPSNLFSKF